MVRTLTLYKRIIEELGLRQLDVYRVKESKGGFKDILRLFDPATSKVFTVDLGKIREATSPLEYLEAVVSMAKKEDIRLPERTIAELKRKFSESHESQ